MGMSDRWYEHAIVYSLDVETFQDSNSDGIGDFGGLSQRLDYLTGLGITCLWLLPFYPTVNRDNGYDITDYYNVDPRLGTLGDFVEFMRDARERGIRVIIDLVVNHTSDQHPWFQTARADAHSPYRDFYVWSDDPPKDTSDEVVFPGKQKSIWTYDRRAKSYYLHRFYDHQPDLNITNPAVRAEICKIMGFWLELGVSGFRVDAAPFLIELKGIEGSNASDEEPFSYLRTFRDFLTTRRGDAVLLAEANVAMDEVGDYFGDGNKLHMLFNFWVNQHLFLALARQAAEPLERGLSALPPIPDRSQWANFVRNHDELDLGRLSDEERQEVFAAFGPEPEMQLYERGIRRRLPPMLGGDWRRLKLAYSLMLTLPGTPVLRYGEELGMGDDLALPERESVRTPMQWSSQANAGFSYAASDKLVSPVIDDERYGYQQLNVAEQTRDPESLLNWMEHAIRVRKGCPEFGLGEWRILKTGAPSVLGMICELRETPGREGIVIALHNLADQPATVTLDLSAYDAAHLIDLLADQRYPSDEGAQEHIELEGYGYRWLRVDGRRHPGP